MKNLLNNMSFEERQNIREQHKGGIKIISDSFRRLVNGKLGNSKPLVMEQTEPLTSAGFNKVTEINLPDGDYMGNPPSYSTFAKSLNLYNVHYILLYSKDNKFTGYILNINSASRSGYDNVVITITGKNSSTGDEYWFKESGYQPTTGTVNGQTTGTNTVINKVASAETVIGQTKVINEVATEGIKNVTPMMISSPMFKGSYSGYQFGGNFNNVDYQWNCNGVEGMLGIRGSVDGEILTETVENMLKSIGKSVDDFKPSSNCVGFYSKDSGFIIYTNTSDKPICLRF